MLFDFTNMLFDYCGVAFHCVLDKRVEDWGFYVDISGEQGTSVMIWVRPDKVGYAR